MNSVPTSKVATIIFMLDFLFYLSTYLKRYILGDQFILPSIIDKEVLKKLLKEAELVSKGNLFNLYESECVIGYLDNKESDSFQFKNILECNSSNSYGTSDILLQKSFISAHMQ